MTGIGDLARLRLERLGQAPVGQQRRVDPAGQVAQVLQRVLRVVEDAVERLALPLLVLTDQPFGQPHLHRQRDELLLRPVVDVALQPSPLLVLRRDQPLARRAEVLDQPEVLQDQPGLRGEVGEQLVLLGQDRIVRRLRDGERAEQLAPVADRRRRRRTSGNAGSASSLRRDRRFAARGHGPRRGRTHLAPTRSQTVASVAPVPSASSRAIRGRMSSPAYVSLTRSENPERTS